jgi:hypothetical protein
MFPSTLRFEKIGLARADSLGHRTILSALTRLRRCADSGRGMCRCSARIIEIPRHHRVAAMLGDQQKHLGGELPFRGLLLGLREAWGLS